MHASCIRFPRYLTLVVSDLNGYHKTTSRQLVGDGSTSLFEVGIVMTMVMVFHRLIQPRTIQGDEDEQNFEMDDFA